MWNNILEDNSLIQLCDTHIEYNDNDLLEIFTLENHAEFTKNFKQYISENNLSQPTNDEFIVQLSVSCNCKVCLTVDDIIEVSFRPVLQDITSLLSTSLINKKFFGKYWNIQYVFQLIHFNYNTQLQDVVIKMLKEITEDTMTEQGVDTPHYVIPKILDQRLQSVRQQRPLLYKEFQVGVLNHVYSDHYGFSMRDNNGHACLEYKRKMDLGTKTLTYVSCFKLKTLDSLKPDGTIGLESISERVEIPTLFLPVETFKSGHGIPIVISIVYEADMSSLSLTAKLVGEEAIAKNIKEHPEPMTLDRF
ncbi:hypothetical protein INT48_002965 [Thamnidium elegans]|uniref:Uncharacterized protein n=1 Tax=Thamnidium elegans TaxID=101142 RepID=A0A8H7VVH3_9FUNG|nr:hypothetical protein INT48_002965 [Thamnidium elegans]